jgi:AraC-like DNA-binding protein
MKNLEIKQEYGDKVLLYKGHPVFGKQTMPSFNRIPKKYQENEACFIFINKGEFSVRSQDDFMELNHDSALLAKCLNYYFETNREQHKNNEVVEVIGILLYPSLVKDLFQFDLAASTHTFDFNLKQVVVDKLLDNFRQSIDMLIENPELADENMIKTKIREFVLLMSKSQNAPSELDFLAAIFKPNEIEFKTTIQKNLYANLTLDELASLCHLSVSSFKRKFKETFNASPKKFITLKKVERASELLRQDDLRISDVAYDSGFDTITTFNRNFLSVYGKSPTQFRSELK